MSSLTPRLSLIRQIGFTSDASLTISFHLIVLWIFDFDEIVASCDIIRDDMSLDLSVSFVVVIEQSAVHLNRIKNSSRSTIRENFLRSHQLRSHQNVSSPVAEHGTCCADNHDGANNNSLLIDAVFCFGFSLSRFTFLTLPLSPFFHVASFMPSSCSIFFFLLLLGDDLHGSSFVMLYLLSLQCSCVDAITIKAKKNKKAKTVNSRTWARSTWKWSASFASIYYPHCLLTHNWTAVVVDCRQWWCGNDFASVTHIGHISCAV